MKGRTTLHALSSLLPILITLLSLVPAQLIFDCPDEWTSALDYCYKFEGDAPLSIDQAEGECGYNGAGLLYVDSLEENSFVKNWLEANDPFQRTWLTSGRGVREQEVTGEGELPFVWGATSRHLPATSQWWLPGQPPADLDLATAVIAYSFGEIGYGWSIVNQGDVHPYICKIPRAEAYRIVQNTRDFDYGTEEEDVNVLERGPHFQLTPRSLVVVSERGEQAYLDCLAHANPEPHYRWFSGEDFEEEVTSGTDSRYTLTSGRLFIQQPEELKDAGNYRCHVSNKYGHIISSPAAITFGYLGEFSNVQNAAVRAVAYDGVAVECSQIAFRPAVRYQWLKDTTQFIRPEFQSYIFISNNGKLYFSEVTRSDEGEYRCIAVLTGVNQYTIGTTQPPTRASLPIPLLVQDQAPKSDWGPEIQNDFPAVFPQPPLRGQDVRIECFAYGSSTSPFFYSWRREGLPMPETAVLEDHNRVLIIRDAQLEDAGTYVCDVMRSSNSRDSRAVYLSLAASPYFVAPLRDQHADVGSQLTWRCDARGSPAPSYSWYRNGQLLTSDPAQRMRVTGNVLRITGLEAAMHDGMYQCGAFNVHGSEMSNAQLRVLSFAPTFAKHPLPSQVTGPVGGHLTIVCNPEGAPLPTITWLRNGNALSTGPGSRFNQLTNGNLVISELTSGDAGQLTCQAENQFGQTSSATQLIIAAGASITQGPTPTTVLVNETAFLPCQASRDPSVDVVFVWYFNDHLIDFSEPDYTRVDEGQGRTGLYVVAAQFKHQGSYTCTVRTPFTQQQRSAYLTVRGPPGMPGGVHVEQGTVSRYNVTVVWTPGAERGATITSYTLQAADEFSPDTWDTLTTVRVQDTLTSSTGETDKRRTRVEGLNPGNQYRFRVLARNQFGLGTPSMPSAYVKTLDAPPAVFPRNVRGGGGSVGVLTLKWDLLHRSEWGSEDVQYRVYWRKKEGTFRDSLWRLAVTSRYEDMHVEVVGDDNFFLLYQVKVQAVNYLGQGPNSTVVEVYSAEELPMGTATNVLADTFNGTALEVTWVPVPDTRKAARGKILGYQLNYWNEEVAPSDYMQSIRHYGQRDSGLVIGLDWDVNTWVDVQVYNSAGLGPRSEAFMQETAGYAPLTWPQEVRVYSAGEKRARVWWRGISIITDEEAVEGYVLYLWSANEHHRSAKEIEVPIKPTEYVLEDLDESILYALRIAAFSGGGFGRKSPTVYFTYEGSVFIDYAFSQTIDVFMAKGATHPPSIFLPLVAMTIAALLARS